MFIAHLPAGYLLTSTVLRKRPVIPRGLFFTGLFFSLAPDLDLLYFYLVSPRDIPHHQYVTHWPLFWCSLAAFLLLLSFVSHKKAARLFIAVGLVNVVLHLVLDSFAAEIYWFAPISRFTINFVHVPATHSWWVWSFVLHWTFAFELMICLAAAAVFIRRNNRTTRVL